MSITWFLAGLMTGLVIGSGAVLFYVNRKFTASMQRFEQEMDFLDGLEEEMK